MRNKRSVWSIPTQPSERELCTACATVFSGAGKRRIKKVDVEELVDGEPRKVEKRKCPKCGALDKWLAHFAAFPEKLVEPCVQLGTSEKGQCIRCGAPWARIVEKPCEACGAGIPSNAQECPHCGNRRDWKEGRTLRDEWLGDEHKPGTGAPRLPGGFTRQTEAARWEPTCQCNEPETEPQIVLDLFAGSGTTLYVARHQGRRALGIELNPQYALLAVDRLKQDVLF